ncbi:DpnII restriction endonuclease [Algoriphagus aquaeductus]|uniref:DpnII restriction endonuclease n=1 Tax=Algoriphagus aquaeductus TaxID=475299 RepID=A0A326S2N6_9BACT|nr:DpnII family type II restriction endonuclease [Algoriphagus aquaeductus]PZV84010.1 DpnII restriction endonuclease [Algoriphagus aquaeductus]
MKRHKQDKEGLINQISEVGTEWKDEFSTLFLETVNKNIYQQKGEINEKHLKTLLDENFEIGITFIRIILEKSKDEFQETLKIIFSDSKIAIGKKGYLENKEEYINKLKSLNLIFLINSLKSKKITWADIIEERLKHGRGSAIKGQKRGKNLEDFVENIIKEVFSEYVVRKSFLGAKGISTAKADFCIPSTENPSIVIEVKAYGATGSKQSDVIGDVKKIIDEKRNDTFFLLFTDGITWKSRLKDFERLIEFQNLGNIYRIYTQKMKTEFLEDLIQLKKEMGIK